jgi:hypothetical protein
MVTQCFQKFPVKGYHKIPVALADIPKMVIIMPFSLFGYICMPFGLSSAAQTFQRMMDCTLDGLKDMFPYMDYSRFGSPDRETHLCHLEAFFAALAANGLAINLDKCVFAVPTLEFLGHNILAAGSTLAADHATAIKTCLPLRTSSNCNVFLAW